jgi:hypothetical protein
LGKKEIHVFISHAWSYSEHYKTLSDWIFKESWKYGDTISLDFRDYSVPKDDPIHDAKNDAQYGKNYLFPKNDLQKNVLNLYY